jgi:preprotein translocase SecE subunit
MNSTILYLKEVQKELQMTTFPSNDKVLHYTSFVLLFTIVMAIYFAILDLGFGKALLSFINYFQ